MRVELGTGLLCIQQVGKVKVQVVEFGTSVQLQSVLSDL